MGCNKIGRWLAATLVFLWSCSGLEQSENQKLKDKNETHQHIYRLSTEYRYKLGPVKAKTEPHYPWEGGFKGGFPRITKEFFRCRGSGGLPQEGKDLAGEKQYVFDCNGNHSLLIKDGGEFIYPVLIELLNFVQEKTEKKVVITCGYRCPIHNAYADNSVSAQTSKHMIGAEVDFYVQGMEDHPQKVIDLIMAYYQNHPTLSKDKGFTKFERFDKETNVSTAPWFNKEIFIKLNKAHEGRDLDNSHPYPYITIQLKYDRDSKQRVVYNWKEAFQGYMRY